MLDLIRLNNITLDAAAAPGAAGRFIDVFCGDYCFCSAEVVGVEGAGFCDIDGADVAALGVDLLGGEAHWVFW